MSQLSYTPEQLGDLLKDFGHKSHRHHAKIIRILAAQCLALGLQVSLQQAQIEMYKKLQERQPKALLEKCEEAA